MYCSNCGQKVLESGNFCWACGAKAYRPTAEAVIEQPTEPERDPAEKFYPRQKDKRTEQPTKSERDPAEKFYPRQKAGVQNQQRWRSLLTLTMRFLLKSVLSLVVIVVATLIAAAGVELFFGVSRPGYGAIIAFAMWAPLLYYKIWRRKQ
jgi:hypothetical protein